MRLGRRVEVLAPTSLLALTTVGSGMLIVVKPMTRDSMKVALGMVTLPSLVVNATALAS
jgi:hypothetical protein